MSFFLTQILNGLVYGMLLALLSAGLSLIFGLMRVVNLAHGSFYMLGAFVGLSLQRATGSFWVALAGAPLIVGALGIAFELLLIRRVYQRGPLDQVLLTFGFTFVAVDVVQSVWGTQIRQLPPPAELAGSISLLGAAFPVYRLFVILLGASVAVLLWLLLTTTRLGTMVRASVDNRTTAESLGIDTALLFAVVFAASVGLAAFAGVAAGPFLGAYPGMDAEIIIPCFIVVVCGGMGSVRGAFVSSLLLGQIETFGRAYFPALAMFLIFGVMIVLLLVRPQGLFGVRQNA